MDPSGNVADIAPSPGVRIHLDCDPCVNYALQQNSVPIVKRVRIENASGNALQDVTVRVAVEPGLAPPLDIRIDSIPRDASHVLDTVELPLSAAKLARQTEREVGSLSIEIRAGDAVLATLSRPLEILAYEEWSGARVLPEILAAFVLPNHPMIETLLGDARDRLRVSTSDPSLSGYQTKNPARVRAVARAIHEAICGWAVTYINPPASFESAGQKVRTPDRIFTTKMGTCLDLTLLYAAALEQAGLHPLLLLVKGHSLVGVWTHEETFPTPLVDSASAIRKRVDLGALLAIETTTAAREPKPSFDVALSLGAAHLRSDDDFRVAIDVRASRRAQIRPLPSRVGGVPLPVPEHPPAQIAEAVSGVPAPQDHTQPDSPSSAIPPADREEAPATPSGRLDRWKRKLLDLGLRNRLLNHREGTKSIPLLCPDVARLEDRLASGDSFQLLPKPDRFGVDDPRRATSPVEDASSALDAFLLSQMESRRLHAGLTAEELDRRLTQIFREARDSLEEGGANILYLGIGFLRWFETATSTQERRAPILLIPLALERRTIVEGFRLKLLDEDPMINVTLLQKLAVDFGLDVEGLDSLDTDEAGLDVALILNRIRRAVLPMERWEVVGETCIGLFSFAKYLMWRDLDQRASAIHSHPVVRHLLETPNLPFAPDTVFPSEDRLDAERSPSSTFCPLDADGTQLRAVCAAADGATFILEGPPGTGKSQTITNMISQALATGQRVLFVSEKMAALNVVHRRLESVGLGDFCLELHSNKAQKSKVMDQMRRALEADASRPVADWESVSRNLGRAREQLNAYAHALHQARGCGLTVFTALSHLMRLRTSPVLDLGLADLSSLTEERLEELRTRVEQAAVALGPVGRIPDNAWRYSEREDWTPAIQGSGAETARRLLKALASLEEAAETLGAALDVRVDSPSLESVSCLRELARVLQSSPSPSRHLLKSDDPVATGARVADWIARGRASTEHLKKLRSQWSEEILSLDLVSLRREIEVAGQSAWPFSWWRARGPRKELNKRWKSGTLPRGQALEPRLSEALACREARRRLQDVDGEARALLDHGWRGEETDWDVLETWATWADEFAKCAARARRATEDGAALQERWIALATSERAQTLGDGPVARGLAALDDANARFESSLAGLAELFAFDLEQTRSLASAPGGLAWLRSTVEDCVRELMRLRGWCAWRRSRRGCVEVGLLKVVDAIEDGRLSSDSLVDAFERSFLEWWIAKVLQAEPLLAQFSRAEHEDRIRKFQNLDVLVTEATHAVVRSRLVARVPRGSVELSSQSTSEIGVLHRELMRQRSRMALRKLFKKIPNALCRLKPCFLMSPLSVAQYLDIELPLFDLVIFDEASQIPTWDAVGAIARGKRLVVVGDSRQLPPTSFFMRTDDPEDLDEDVVEDLESILDDCKSARFPQLPLGWHYRSRHEHLIAFSNYHYYENGLLTFPSAEGSSEHLGVTWRHLPAGCYDRGKSRTNRVEAEALVAMLIERLRDPAGAKKSYGIVTFSVAQQVLVEDLLDAARRRHPEVEPAFAADAREPLFVKNLENVQGDERDVILFSVCYGPDSLGQVALNFGPLNRDGGERRLNVAITRAREQLVVFSSLRSDQIDLTRTRALGVRHMKAFLDYAEHGPRVLAQALAVDGGAETESHFEQEVRNALEARGWEVVPQVGCSRYRIDLGVKDPRAPGRFLLGVECDGAMYHSAKTARERDRLRQAVLGTLGWSIYRIWSTDWWQDRKGETERLHAALTDELARSAPTGASVPRSSSRAATELFASSAPVAVPRRSLTDARSTSSHRLAGMGEYQAAVLELVRGRAGEAYYEPIAATMIADQIERVLAAEAPIELRLLAQRVVEAWGLSRATDRAQARLCEVLFRMDARRIAARGVEFVWRSEQDPSGYRAFRVSPDDSLVRRTADQIPREEYANAAAAILEDHLRMDRTSLAREAARLLGFQRMGSRVEDAGRDGVELLVSSGRAKVGADGDVQLGPEKSGGGSLGAPSN